MFCVREESRPQFSVEDIVKPTRAAVREGEGPLTLRRAKVLIALGGICLGLKYFCEWAHGELR
jgi:hypothetical protein